ncbi:MAG: glycosyltransferase family 2 protein, partial [Pseudomonadota bacterium]
FFFVLEDDNHILPNFIRDNIALCEREDVNIVFRNQLMEFDSATDHPTLSAAGILENKLSGGRYEAELFHLCLMADIGVSNGGLFWSRDAVTDLEIHYECSATLQEYLRTFTISEPIYVAMEPLAVWAHNGQETTRDLGSNAGYYKRELSLKRSIGILQRKVWARTSAVYRKQFLTDPVFRYPKQQRAKGLVKSHTRLRVGQALKPVEVARLAFRGALIRLIGKAEPGLWDFINSRAS